MNVKTLLIPLFFLFNVSSVFADQYEDAAKSKRWQRLLHYQKSFWGSSYKSRTDDKRFFLDPNGYWDPVWELKTNIKEFKKPVEDESKVNLHAQCRFPARYKFAKELFPNEKFTDIQCPDFKWWYDQIGAKGIALVFSSYYASNPASMFGHTLMKLIRDKEGMGSITDLGLNFAAETGNDKGITYIINGLMGGYFGKFSTLPYYNKLNDYINGESRDVWEYRLKFDENQTDWVVKHIWELKNNAFFDYYFLDVNCAYLLLTLLEVGNLEWDISQGFFFYALPMDTVKRLVDVDGIDLVNYRPSFRKKLYSHYEALNDSEKQTFVSLIQNKIPVKDIKVPQIVDAYTAFLRYQRYEKGDDDILAKETKRKIRESHLHRAKLGVVEVPEISKPADPLTSHHGYKMGLATGYHNNFEDYLEFQFRFGIHDMTTNASGLPPFSNLEFVGAKLRYYEELEKFHLEEFTAFNLLTLNDWDLLTKDVSWGASAKLKSADDLGVVNRYLAELRPHVGFAKHIFNKKIAVASLAIVDLQYGPALNKNYYRIAPGIKLGLNGTLAPRLTANLWFSALHSLDKEYDEILRYEGESSLSYSFNQSFELGIFFNYYSSSINGLDDTRDSKLNLHYFF